MKFMEEKLVPVAAKIGSQRHLVAIRDAFIIVMPLTIAGSLATLFGNFSGIFAANGLNMPGVEKAIADFLANTKLDTVFGAIGNGTLNIMAILFIVCLGYNLANSRGVHGMAAGTISLAVFMSLAPTYNAGINAGIEAIGGTLKEGQWTFLQNVAGIDARPWVNTLWLGDLDASGLFVAMIVGFIATELFCVLSKMDKLKITLPDGVPPAVANSFTVLLPSLFTVFAVVGVFQLFQAFSGNSLWYWIATYLAKPLQGVTGSMIGMLVIIFFVHILWIFGLHGANIVGAVTSPILAEPGNQNIQRFANKLEPENTITGGFFSAFSYLGGSGATIGLIIAIFLFSKSKAQRTVATIAVAPGIFEINEPLTFGLPIVLNPILAIPFIVGPMVLGVLTYLLMEAGVIRRICADVPWVTPPVIIGFLATGGDWKGAVWNVIEIAILTVIWTPFVIASSRMEASN